MKKLLLLLAVPMLIFFAYSNCMAWTEVYENDVNGNGTYGNLQTLIDAVNAGKQVRFLMTEPDGTVYVLDANTVWVKNNMVYAQNTSHVAVSMVGNIMVVQNDAYYAYFTVSTLGDMNHSGWRVGAHTRLYNIQGTRAMKWFVN